MIVYRCNLEEDINKYKETFKSMDTNKNGFIEHSQLAELLKKKITDPIVLRKIVFSVDFDVSGKIYWTQFLSSVLAPNLILTISNLQDIFNYFDQNGKGYFTSQDV